METTIIQKFIHTSPRKLRLVADMVRKMQPARALETLQFTPKYAAKDLSLAIKAALSSAKQGGLNEGAVFFKALEVNGGPVMKRFTPASKGRALPFKRRMSHIKIVLSDEVINKKKLVETKPKKEAK